MKPIQDRLLSRALALSAIAAGGTMIVAGSALESRALVMLMTAVGTTLLLWGLVSLVFRARDVSPEEVMFDVREMLIATARHVELLDESHASDWDESELRALKERTEPRLQDALGESARTEFSLRMAGAIEQAKRVHPGVGYASYLSSTANLLRRFAAELTPDRIRPGYRGSRTA